MKNVLSDKQKHQLNKWIEDNAPHGLYQKYSYACDAASSNIGFNVTYSNIKSAEEATGMAIVKVKEPKAVNNHEARIAKLENDIFHLMQICRRLDASENLNIKPSAPKPVICHKHG